MEGCVHGGLCAWRVAHGAQAVLQPRPGLRPRRVPTVLLAQCTAHAVQRSIAERHSSVGTSK